MTDASGQQSHRGAEHFPGRVASMIDRRATSSSTTTTLTTMARHATSFCSFHSYCHCCCWCCYCFFFLRRIIDSLGLDSWRGPEGRVLRTFRLPIALFYRVYLVLPSFTEFCLVLPSFFRFFLALLPVEGQVLRTFRLPKAQFYLVLFSFTEFYRVP